MIDYKDPVEPLVNYLVKFFEESEVYVVGGDIPAELEGTILGVRHAGGSPYAVRPYTRVRLLARADVDYDALDTLTAAVNELERYGTQIRGVKVFKIAADGRPVPDTDADTEKPEAWIYILIYHLEA